MITRIVSPTLIRMLTLQESRNKHDLQRVENSFELHYISIRQGQGPGNMCYLDIRTNLDKRLGASVDVQCVRPAVRATVICSLSTVNYLSQHLWLNGPG